MTPIELHAHLSANPGKSYATLDAEACAIMRSHLRSSPDGFTQQQRDWLLGFFLVVPSQAALEATTAKLPPGLGLSARTTIAGELVLPASLLTDSMQEGDTWAAIADDLVGFEIRFIPAEDFPAPEEFT